jgi:hypothetical protein
VALSEFGDADRSLYVRQLDQNRSFGPIRPGSGAQAPAGERRGDDGNSENRSRAVIEPAARKASAIIAGCHGRDVRIGSPVTPGGISLQPGADRDRRAATLRDGLYARRVFICRYRPGRPSSRPCDGDGRWRRDRRVAECLSSVQEDGACADGCRFWRFCLLGSDSRIPRSPTSASP